MSAVAIIFANLKGNLGDFALLEAGLAHVARDYPGRALHVWPHGFLGIDEARLDAFVNGGVPAFTLPGKTAPQAFRKLARAGLGRSFGTALNGRLVRHVADRYDATARQFAEYERVFVVGGDQFDLQASASMFGTLCAIARHNPRLSCMPMSINPRTLQGNDPARLGAYLALFETPPLVRDRATHDFLGGLGIPSWLAADAVLTLAPDVERIDAAPRTSDTVILSLAASAPQHVDTFGPSITALIGQGFRVEAHTTCAPADQKLLDALQRAYGVPVCAPMTWQEAAANFKAARLVVSNRFHSLLLSAMAGTTVMPVGNRAKTAAFIRETGVPCHAGGLADITPERVATALGEADTQGQMVDSYIRQGQERLDRMGWRTGR